MYYKKAIGIAILLTIFFGSVKAQELENNIRMTKVFKADGISNEWDEPLNEFNSDTRLAFALANDDRNLYIIIESLDPQTTFSILRGGITLNINTEGKKKNGINLVFPLIHLPEHAQEDIPGKDLPVQDKPLDANAIDKKMRVSGFKNVPDGELSLENGYGIQAGMTIKPNRDLIYELCIPLAQLEVTLNASKPLVYNIKLNAPSKGKRDFKGKEGDRPSGGRSGGMPRGGMGSGGKMGGMGGGGRGSRPMISQDSSSPAKSDFWIKFELAKS